MDAHTRSAAAPQTLFERDRRFAVHLMEHLVVPAFVLGSDGRVVIWNKACERLTGVAADDVVATFDHWKAFYTDMRPCLADLVIANRFDEISFFYKDFMKFGLTDFGISVENWCDLPQLGRRAYLAIDAGPIYDDAGTIIAVVETLRDITAQREAQDALEALASLDGLTGLANRRSFDQALAKEAQRSARTGAPLSVLMMDIDHFKLFNDTYGHSGGDECLKRVAQAAAGAVKRAGDVVARYGGEEFAVVLPDTGIEGATAIAERMRYMIEDLRIEHCGVAAGANLTVSVGGATAGPCDPDPARLLAAADVALYRSKRGGRNRFNVVAIDPAAAVPERCA